MILKSYELLLKNKQPSSAQIVEHMEGQLCRCSTYPRVIEAIQTASAEMRGGKS